MKLLERLKKDAFIRGLGRVMVSSISRTPQKNAKERGRERTTVHNVRKNNPNISQKLNLGLPRSSYSRTSGRTHASHFSRDTSSLVR